MPLRLEVEELDAQTAVVTFDGLLTLSAELRVAEESLAALIERGFTRLVFDLAAVPYCDSSGLGVLVRTYGLALGHVGLIRLCRVAAKVAVVLTMTNTDTLLPMDPDRASSLAAMPRVSRYPAR
ncbi:MAG TPA: STAS domain-containing protein [Acidobacteriaceae bacterium]